MGRLPIVVALALLVVGCGGGGGGGGDLGGAVDQATPDGATACVSDGNCPIPLSCALCADGSSACFTAACVAGVCVTMAPQCPPPRTCHVDTDCPQPRAPCNVCAGGVINCPSDPCVAGSCELHPAASCPPECAVDTDCVAPAMCRTCSDGVVACARGKCVGGKCTAATLICP